MPTVNAIRSLFSRGLFSHGLYTQGLYKRLTLTLAIMICALQPAWANTPPVVDVTSPEFGPRDSGAVSIRGSATDSDGIERIIFFAKDLATGRYWTGNGWASGYTTVNAQIQASNSTYAEFAAALPDINTAIWLGVRAIDRKGAYGATWQGKLDRPTAAASGGSSSSGNGTTVQVGEKPEVVLIKPGAAFAGGTLAVSGTASDADGIRQVVATVKDLDNGRYWNGSSWQSGYVWIPATLSNPGGTSTSYDLSLQAPAHRFYVAVRAQDESGSYGQVSSVQTVVTAPPPSPSPPTPPVTGTATLCQGPVIVGVAIDLYSHNAGNSNYNATYDSLVDNHFCYVSSENSLKRSYIENATGAQNLAIPDSYVASAERYGVGSRGHSLVWNYRDPAYLGNLGAAEVGTAMDNFIEQMMSRYPTVDDWDVVNEPLGWNGLSFWAGVYDKLEGSNGFPPVDVANRTVATPEYIKRAFRKADEVRRNNSLDTRLWLNESNVLDPASPKYGSKVEVLYNMVKRMIADGIPIDGVGFQGHIRVAGPTPLAIWGSTYDVPELDRTTAPRICANLKRFRDLGLKISITEFDVAIPVNPSNEQLLAQIEAYKLMYRISAELGLDDLTIWGLDDGRSFYLKPFTYNGTVGTVVPGWGNATLFDTAMRPKAVFDELADFIRNYDATAWPKLCP